MREIKLQGVHNIRDLGGIALQGGGAIIPGKLIRSSKLTEATEMDIRRLMGTYGLRQIIDLRTPTEAAEAPDAEMPGVDTHFLPLISEEAFVGVTRDKESLRAMMQATKFPEMTEIYAVMVSERAEASWRKIFDVLLNNRGEAVLWHCAEGKDRCGLVSAMVLYALGASMEDIEEDYLLTNKTAEPRAEEAYQKALQRTGQEEIAENVRAAYVARKEYFEMAFAEIEKRHGTVEGFLENGCGLDAARLLELRKRYTAKA